MTDINCKDCAWWYCSSKPDDPEFLKIVTGDCRRYAPRVFQIGGISYDAECKTVLPHTKGGDFCGEFAPRADRRNLLETDYMKGEPAARIIGRIKPGDAA
jgi:hypothetical protein